MHRRVAFTNASPRATVSTDEFRLPLTPLDQKPPRALLIAAFLNGTGTYTMDDVIMREKSEAPATK